LNQSHSSAGSAAISSSAATTATRHCCARARESPANLPAFPPAPPPPPSHSTPPTCFRPSHFPPLPLFEDKDRVLSGTSSSSSSSSSLPAHAFRLIPRGVADVSSSSRFEPGPFVLPIGIANNGTTSYTSPIRRLCASSPISTASRGTFVRTSTSNTSSCALPARTAVCGKKPRATGQPAGTGSVSGVSAAGSRATSSRIRTRRSRCTAISSRTDSRWGPALRLLKGTARVEQLAELLLAASPPRKPGASHEEFAAGGVGGCGGAVHTIRQMPRSDWQDSSKSTGWCHGCDMSRGLEQRSHMEDEEVFPFEDENEEAIGSGVGNGRC
ncbi:hypothetical protein CLOM_g9074, partial [Closterium sp. NIES-68]